MEKLFRQNNRTNRSRSLDVRANERPDRPSRPVGSSHSARYTKNRCVRSMDDGGFDVFWKNLNRTLSERVNIGIDARGEAHDRVMLG